LSPAPSILREEIVAPLVPFLKWAGGKRWLARRWDEIFPAAITGTYFEPFLGGGSIFAAIRPENAVLSDINGELINAYRQIKLHWKQIEEGLESLQENHSRDFYYSIRGTTPETSMERALRFLYLNRTCFNGLYRVNLQGKFNVPIGTKSAIVLPEDDFKGWSKALRRSRIVESDFEGMIDQAAEGDFIFADPPYTVLHNQNCFLKYNEVLFSWKDQARLAKALLRADRRGVRILATNANHHSVRELYEGKFHIDIVSRASTIAASSMKRGSFEEIIIRSQGA
jgi:DNA adenine methylase